MNLPMAKAQVCRCGMIRVQGMGVIFSIGSLRM
jgi:hypothetical protein